MQVRKPCRLLYHRIGKRRGSATLCSAVDQLGEGLGLEARAAYQTAIHIPLRHDVVYVLRLDRATVEDADLLCELFPADLPQEVADAPDGVLRVLWGSGLAGPDGPHRLVGEDDILTANLARVELLEDRPDLCGDLVPHRARVAPLLGLADADDGEEPGGDGPDRFVGHQRVRLTEDLSPLRV